MHVHPARDTTDGDRHSTVPKHAGSALREYPLRLVAFGCIQPAKEVLVMLLPD